MTSIQARLCQCFYLLSQSRVNHCWSLFGTTAHLILALGIHRKRRLESHINIDMIELECRKRVFWSAYSLDNYLSAALGRPRTFHDDDIDQVSFHHPPLISDIVLTLNTRNSQAASMIQISLQDILISTSQRHNQL